MSNLLVSIARTVVPALWGSFIAWLLSALPVLAPLENELLGYSTVIVPFIITLIIGLWYAAWRKLEPHVPDWIVQLVLGSAKRPVYVEPKDAVVRADGTVDLPGPDHRAT